MENFPNNLPNWLRYILAIPCGIIFTLIVVFFILLSANLFSDPNSIYNIFINFILANLVSVMLFFWGINMMLPKHKFVITLTISIIFGITYSILQGLHIAHYGISIEYTIGYICFLIGLIISCIFSFKNKFE